MQGGSCGCFWELIDADASRRTLEAIRLRAVDALLVLPRVGLGAGGFLLGVRHEGKIRILDRLEIPCEHALGPAFELTDAESKHAAGLRTSAAPLEIVGFYVSRTRGPFELSDSMIELFDALCPNPGQIALLIRPSTVEPVRAALFARAPDNTLERRGECELEFALAAETVETANANADASKAMPFEHEANTALAPPPDDFPAEDFPVPVPVAEPVPAAPTTLETAKPVFFRDPETDRKGARRTLLFAAGALVLFALAAVLAAGSSWFFTPELSLDIAEDGPAVVFHWNREAIAGAERGSMFISESNQLTEISLDAAQLASGALRYERKSDRVVAKLTVGDRSAHAVFFGSVWEPPGR